MRRVATLLLCTLVAACGGGDPTNPGGGGGGITNFTAKIDGVDWAPEFAVTAINPTPGFYSITAVKTMGANNYTMVLQVFNITGPGTYPLGVTVQMIGGTAQLSQAPSSGWGTPGSGAAGQVVITTLSATQMVGTFEFTATPLMGSAVNKTVTQGQFDIPVSGTGGLAAANQGSTVTASLGGQAFTAATGSIILTTGGNPVLTIVATNLTRNITISLADMTGAATYTLSTSSPVRTIQVGDGTGMVWTSGTTGGSGSVTISSVTAQRIIGSFTATVIGFLGGATGPMTVSGNFSMGRII